MSKRKKAMHIGVKSCNGSLWGVNALSRCIAEAWFLLRFFLLRYKRYRALQRC